jgi:hypothetical protein
MPFGTSRTAALAMTGAIHGLATDVGLDRPALWVAATLGRRDEVPRFRPPTPAAAAGAHSTVPVPTAAPTFRPRPRTPVPVPVAGPATITFPSAVAAVATPTATPARRPAAGLTEEAQPRPLRPLGPIVPRPARPAGRAISPAAPLRVHIAGDSFAQPLGYHLARYGTRDGMITTQLDFKISSGLVRPDFFDWPARLAATMQAELPPEAIVVNLGGNDYQNLRTGEGVLRMGAPDWAAEYGRRAGVLMDLVEAQGARLYWVGMPITRDEGRNAAIRGMNAAVQAEAARRPWVQFVDSWSLFADAGGQFATYLPDETGQMVHVRQNDGIHLTMTGTQWVARQVYEAIGRDWDLAPPTPTPAMTPPGAAPVLHPTPWR